MTDPSKISEMSKAMDAARVAESALFADALPSGDSELTPEFIQSCLEQNERGDGLLYATVHRGKFVYVKSRDEKSKAWFRWAGHYWEIDKGDFHHAAVEDVALVYANAAIETTPQVADWRDKANAAAALVASLTKQLKQLSKDDATPEDLAEIEQQLRTAEEDRQRATGMHKFFTRLKKEYTDRVERLRSLRGAKNCTEFAHKLGINGLFIYGDEVDQRPLLLPCSNGVIDLPTGKLRDGLPEDYLVRAIPVTYNGINTPAPTWERFIREIHRDCPLLYDFIHRFFGYCLTGLDIEQVYAFFIGEGANGKGLMFEVIKIIFGELSWSISPEMLLESKTPKNPSGPSPDIMSLQGRRLVMASETDDGRKISSSNMKRYTGGDTLTGRNLFDIYDHNFLPTHKLVVYSNHTPRGLAADFAMFRRLLYITYDLRYVDDPIYHAKAEPQQAHLFRQKDPDLKKKLLAEKEGILAWLMRGCLLWQHDGLKIPDSIRAAVEEVRRKEDHVQLFIDSVCERVAADDPNQGVYFAPLYRRYAEWYKTELGAEEKYLISKRRFGEHLRRKGFNLPDPRTSSGKQGVCGLTFTGADYEALFTWSGPK